MTPINWRDELANVGQLVRQTSVRDSVRIAQRPRKKAIHVTQRIGRRRRRGLAFLANALRLLPSSIRAVFTLCKNVPTGVRTIIGRVERGFADFAEIPYQDALTRQDISLLLNEFEAKSPAWCPHRAHLDNPPSDRRHCQTCV